MHLSPRRGTSLEFADYRSYAAGDDPRTVDWGLYARTDRLYVKVFQEEEDLFGYLFIDASASMAHPEEDTKYRAATALALALCYVILSSGRLRAPAPIEDGPKPTRAHSTSAAAACSRPASSSSERPRAERST